MKDLHQLIPDFPRTRHFFHNANASRTDLIASKEECQIVFENKNVFFEEKIDGSNSGMCCLDGNPIIRNRNHFLHKGFQARTPAKQQYSSIWNWFYENREKFEKLNNLVGFPITIYGEWMVALHGVKYDKLPDYFIAFDLYDWQKKYFIDTGKTRTLLNEVGFQIVPLLFSGKLPSLKFLDQFCEEKSQFSSTDKREGIYIKITDGEKIIERFKMVRKDFIQGERWSDREIKRNKLLK